jgi:hypothetical protein
MDGKDAPAVSTAGAKWWGIQGCVLSHTATLADVL